MERTKVNRETYAQLRDQLSELQLQRATLDEHIKMLNGQMEEVAGRLYPFGTIACVKEESTDSSYVGVVIESHLLDGEICICMLTAHDGTILPRCFRPLNGEALEHNDVIREDFIENFTRIHNENRSLYARIHSPRELFSPAELFR